VHHDKRSPSFQALVDRAKRLESLLSRNEVKGEQRRCAVKRPLRSAIDIAFVEGHSSLVRSSGLLCECQHFSRRVYPVEAPLGLFAGKGIDFQTPSSTVYKDSSIGGDTLGEQQPHHAVQAGEARNLVWWSVQVGVP